MLVRVLKCLDHDDMVGSRICMSKDVELSKILFSTVHFAPTWWIRNKYSNDM